MRERDAKEKGGKGKGGEGRGGEGKGRERRGGGEGLRTGITGGRLSCGSGRIQLPVCRLVFHPFIYQRRKMKREVSEEWYSRTSVTAAGLPMICK
jgi:hypothetical protein